MIAYYIIFIHNKISLEKNSNNNSLIIKLMFPLDPKWEVLEVLVGTQTTPLRIKDSCLQPLQTHIL